MALVGWRTARARALVRLGDVERADRLGRQAVSLAEQTDSSDLRANALLHLAEVLRLSGRPNEAQPFERRAFRLLDRTGASAQAAAVFRNLSPETDAPSPEVDDDADIVPEAEPVSETLVEDDDEPTSEPEPEQASEPETAGAEAEIVEEERPLPPPIAEAFAASSEAEKKKRGRFRR
jgi:tetratricopeptide (TPR) repeat protein